MEADQRAKLERLARYVSRPLVSIERLALTAQGQVRYHLKTPYRDGTTHIVLEPVDFMARLAALEQQSVELAQLKQQVAMMAAVIARLDHAQMVAEIR